MTKEEILIKNVETLVNCKVTYNMTNQGILAAMQEYADQQSKAKDDEIAELKTYISEYLNSDNLMVKSLEVRIKEKQSQIEQLTKKVDS